MPAGRRRFRASCCRMRQHERGGLPGAGLRAGEDVAALERDRDDLALDGRGLGVVLLEHGAHQGLHEAESGERRRRDPLDRLRKQRLARRVLGRVRDRAVGDEGGTSRPAASPKGPAAATIMHETQWITLSRGGARTSARIGSRSRCRGGPEGRDGAPSIGPVITLQRKSRLVSAPSLARAGDLRKDWAEIRVKERRADDLGRHLDPRCRTTGRPSRRRR